MRQVSNNFSALNKTPYTMEKDNNETSKIKDLENFRKDMTGNPLLQIKGLKSTTPITV